MGLIIKGPPSQGYHPFPYDHSSDHHRAPRSGKTLSKWDADGRGMLAI